MTSKLLEILRNHESEILSEWIGQQTPSSSRGRTSHEGEQRQHSAALLRAIRSALEAGASTDITTPQWESVRELLSGISRTRARQGSTAAETATFILSLK